MKSTKNPYEPFGVEWRKEVMKMKKADIVGLLKQVAIEENKILKLKQNRCGEQCKK